MITLPIGVYSQMKLLSSEFVSGSVGAFIHKSRSRYSSSYFTFIFGTITFVNCGSTSSSNSKPKTYAYIFPEKITKKKVVTKQFIIVSGILIIILIYKICLSGFCQHLQSLIHQILNIRINNWNLDYLVILLFGVGVQSNQIEIRYDLLILGFQDRLVDV